MQYRLLYAHVSSGTNASTSSSRLAVSVYTFFDNWAIHFACVNFFLFLMMARRQIISGSAGPIFAIFAPNDRYLFVDDRSGALF